MINRLSKNVALIMTRSDAVLYNILIDAANKSMELHKSSTRPGSSVSTLQRWLANTWDEVASKFDAEMEARHSEIKRAQ